MTSKRPNDEVFCKLPGDCLPPILEFAIALTDEEERLEWQVFGRNALSRVYGPDEPEYTEADFKVRYKS